MSDGQTELMSLSILDLYRLQLEFQETFEAMQEDEREMLQKLLIIKLASIEGCEKVCEG
jgi:hypothetical protein